MKKRPAFPTKIISGGQTGADRAALDWAIQYGMTHGGWCPKGRRAEDGPLDARYQLTQTPSSAYAERTRWNVRDADATIIISLSETLSGGSLLTRQIAEELGRPWLHLWPSQSIKQLGRHLAEFVTEHRVRVLNVAGPREAEGTELREFVREVLTAALGKQNKGRGSRGDADGAEGRGMQK
jgi:hypothetical protein